MIYAIWTPDRTVEVATRKHRPAKVRAKTLREAAAAHASRMGFGTHVLCLSPCPLTFPAAVHELTLVVEPHSETFGEWADKRAAERLAKVAARGSK